MTSSALEWSEHTFIFDNGKSKTRYLETGSPDGPLLIFVHGWIGCAETWKPQLLTFASLGFRCIAPDTRGYGGSTNTTEGSDYRTEQHVLDLVALLVHLEKDRAVWIGHDWGAPLVWSFAAHYPEKCIAVAGMCVPYRTAEFGPAYLASLREPSIYPKDEFEYAQWDYMVYHNEDPEFVSKMLDAKPENTIKTLFMPGKAGGADKPAHTATRRKNKSWYGPGMMEAPDVPLEKTLVNEHPDIFDALVETVRENGTQGPNKYYQNFPANEDYACKSVNDGVLSFPVLFIGARYDYICETANNRRLTEPMRESCKDLTSVTIDAGHWVALEKPSETNAVLVKWLATKVEGYWPSERTSSWEHTSGEGKAKTSSHL